LTSRKNAGTKKGAFAPFFVPCCSWRHPWHLLRDALLGRRSLLLPEQGLHQEPQDARLQAYANQTPYLRRRHPGFTGHHARQAFEQQEAVLDLDRLQSYLQLDGG